MKEETKLEIIKISLDIAKSTTSKTYKSQTYLDEYLQNTKKVYEFLSSLLSNNSDKNSK